MDNRKDDKYYIEKILVDINKIISYVSHIQYEEFLTNEQLNDAVLFRLIQISENIKKLSDKFKEENKVIPWNEIFGFRNRIVHDYGSTDYSIVYEVVKEDLPSIKEILEQAINI